MAFDAQCRVLFPMKTPAIATYGITVEQPEGGGVVNDSADPPPKCLERTALDLEMLALTATMFFFFSFCWACPCTNFQYRPAKAINGGDLFRHFFKGR